MISDATEESNDAPANQAPPAGDGQTFVEEQKIASDILERTVSSIQKVPLVAGLGVSLEGGNELHGKEVDATRKRKAKTLHDHAKTTTGIPLSLKTLIPGARQVTGGGTSTTITEPGTADEDLLNAWRNEVHPIPSIDSSAGNQVATSRQQDSVPGAWPVEPAFRRASDHGTRLNTNAPNDELGTSDSSNIHPLQATLSPIESLSRPRDSNHHHHQQIQQPSPQENNHPLVEAKVEPETPHATRQAVYFFAAVLILIVAVILLILGLVGVYDDNGGHEESTSQDDGISTLVPTTGVPPVLINNSTNRTNTTEIQRRPTIEQVRESGVLQCAYIELPGLMYRHPMTGEVSGFSSVWCKAIAAALTTVDRPTIRVNYSDFNPFLQRNGQHQVNPVGLTHTMERHVTGSSSGRGVSFSRPTLYGGTRVAGQPFYVDCAVNKDFRHVDECQGLTVCVMGESSQQPIAQSLLPSRLLHISDSPGDVILDFVAGNCTTFLLESLAVAEPVVRRFGYTGNYSVGDAIYSKTPIALVTTRDDPQWADFVNAVVQALLVAERHNITRETADMMPEFKGFGEDYRFMFQNAIRAVGNYEQVYQEHVGPFLPRDTLNQLNEGSSGLLYSHPLGSLSNVPGSNERQLGHNLMSILERGMLRCGMEKYRRFYLEEKLLVNVTGINTDYCRAVAASLFGGDTSAVQLVDLENPQDGYQKLASDEIDVFAGATWTLANDVQEVSTGLGFAYSQPYLYTASSDDDDDDDDEVEDNLCLAVMQDDHDWLTYTYWIVAATIYADEKDIHQSGHNGMPLIDLYGVGLERLFRDTILAIGNYDEIYNRNFPNMSRSGRNTLNNDIHPGRQHYPMPGFFFANQ